MRVWYIDVRSCECSLAIHACVGCVDRVLNLIFNSKPKTVNVLETEKHHKHTLCIVKQRERKRD